MIAIPVSPPSPVGAIPSTRQIAWHQHDYYAFVHFGPNTFTGNEWGSGQESTQLFNPTHLDCMQWCRAFKAAGMSGVIITAKHHDGFCLWPSKYSTHTVAQSPWKNGKGDVLLELSRACRKTGLKFGVYLSPWDRNHPTYGTPEYNQAFVNMLGEVLGHYGKVFEVWFDGANGEGPNGKKQVYDWPLFNDTVHRFQPDACIFSDGGPDIRWVGNEDGHAAPTVWCTLRRDLFSPGHGPTEQLPEGHEDGNYWVPPECDVSIRPGWFWRASENDKVKTAQQLEELYYESVGQNAHLLLNVPANTDGLISREDIESLIGLRARFDATFKTDLGQGKTATCSSYRANDPRFSAQRVNDTNPNTYWCTDDGITTGSITIDLGKPTRLDRVLLQEFIPLGQRVEQFSVDACIEGNWQTIATGTTIGAKRILRVSPVAATELRLNILQARACPTIATFALYKSPDS